jgi:hypothetical protein
MIRRFVFLQATVTLAAAIACKSSETSFTIFVGIIGAQASLMGNWTKESSALQLCNRFLPNF